MASSGYSGTPLSKKLGIKDGTRLYIINEPDHYFSLFSDLPSDVDIITTPKSKVDIVHYFVTTEKELGEELLNLKDKIELNGAIWVSWPKKAAKVETDITEDVIRALALKNGLVDIKVCAIDAKWSALKLVIPGKDRK